MLKKVIKQLFYRFFYNNYWKNHNSIAWDYGINIIPQVIDNYEFNSILDAGCGKGDVVKYLLRRNFDAYGVEISSYAIKKNAHELLNKRIFISSLENIPFKDSYFDVVFCSDVLEHIPEYQIDKVVSELCRVCKKHLFLTINLRPSSNNNKYHITLRSREWWELKFTANGVKINYQMVNKLQSKNVSLNMRQIMELGPTVNIINEIDWFISNPPYSLNGELEPWFFIFEK